MDFFSRTKSYSQAQGTSGTPSPKPSPQPAHSASSPSNSNNPVVKNILKNVESHVRIMSHVERTSTSSSFTALRLRCPDEEGSETGTAEDGGGWSAPYAVTRVHRGGSTSRFYEEVVAPCVSNCTSGQSYLFLLNGPPESGRSQTLYGSPHHSETGIVELAARDLLERMSSTGNIVMKSHRDGQNKENEGGTSAGVGEEEGEAPTRTGGITVTYSAFTTRGHKMLETVTGEAVPLVEFPPPLGLVPLPTMRLLEDAAAAVQLPEKKHVDTSCVIQFQVYAPVDTTGRRSMATLTFVDVAAIRLPLCKEVAHLVETVARVAGNGGDAHFKETKLTTLLEPALVGYVTMVSVTTISGRADLYESTCAALDFASNITKIHQVLMLTHINAPRWLFETGVNLEQIRSQRDAMLSESYAKGVYDYYQRTSQFLLKNASDADGALQVLLEETSSVRQDIAKEVEEQSKSLQGQIESEDGQCREEVEAARNAHGSTSRKFDDLKQLDEAIATLEQNISQTDLQCGHRISEMRLEISALEAKTNTQRQQLQQLEKEMKLYVLKGGEVGTTLSKYAEDLQVTQGTFAAKEEMLRLGQKRTRMEAELELASQVAHRQTDSLRVDRERRSRLSRLTVMNQRIKSLRDTMRASSARNTSSSAPSTAVSAGAATAGAAGGRRKGEE